MARLAIVSLNCNLQLYVLTLLLLDDVPKDLIPIIVIEKVQMWAFALTILLSIAGGVCIVICFLFTFLFRKSK